MPPMNKFWEWAKRDSTLTNVTVAVFTVVIAGVGILQWNAIDGQLTAMIEAERPWLGGVNVTAEPIASGQKGVTKLSVINSGRSPARILSFHAAQKILPPQFPSDPPYDNISTAWQDLSQTILLPGMIATNEFPFSEIEPTQFQLLLATQLRLYVYGIVEYEDLRVKGIKHTTKMCFFWTARKQSAPFVTCPEYNEAN